ncbi:MAG: oxidoreductase [Lachnospiraceae bacterium]|nr:oxidoreductase [Lachnospiraceae bacterium]
MSSFYTVKELADAGSIPDLYQVTKHLVFSSPATLAYNSPGAEGFGVKRAGLSIPESVMLIVSPACCGRNTSQISSMDRYRNRFFYLQMDETDLVTGRHLKSIPQAVGEIVDYLEVKPKLVMICATCADALLGTDWERVCRRAEENTGVRVRPCYMYALTREGLGPPMVHVRQSLYSLLEKRDKVSTSVNLLGFFSPVSESWEMFSYLRKAGVKTIRQISTCASFEEFLRMSEANFNLVLNPECRSAADDLASRLNIPYVELRRFYDPDRIHRQYGAFSGAAGIMIDDGDDYRAASEALDSFCDRMRGYSISIGECANADPFELALTLAKRGLSVREIFAPVNEESGWYIRGLSEISPDTRVYCSQDPSMLYYEDDAEGDCLTIGKDAAYYHPRAVHVYWNSDVQPYGYAAVRELVEKI